jgi:hypothetical protein
VASYTQPRKLGKTKYKGDTQMLDKEKEVQGVALYAQLHKPGAMTQLIITPDGFDEKGDKVLASLYRRIVTHESPKKQWRSSIIPTAVIEDMDFEDGTHRADFAQARIGFASQLFDSLLTGKWELHKEPIYLEVSKKDLTDIREAKTPTKLLYRVNQTREALNFETEIPKYETH